MPFTQEQAIQLLALLSEGKLISELDELFDIDTNNNFIAINSGSNDARKVKIPLLRGYKGTYNASTNTPSLSNTVGLEGDMYVVSVAGSRDFGAGTVNLLVDDIIIYLNGKYLKTNGIVTGSLDLQGAYNNSSPKTITVADSTDGTLTVKDSATNNNRDEILQVQDTSGNILFYVHRDKVYIKDNLGIGTENPISPLTVMAEVGSSVPSVGNASTHLSVGKDNLYGTMLGTLGSGVGFLQQQRFDGTATTYNLLIQPNGGNVGIGTTSASEKLEVAGNIKSSGDIKLDRTKKIIFDTDDNQESTILYNTSNTSLDYSTDSKHRFIDNTGQLFTIEANLISLSGSVKTDEITTYSDNTNLELSAHGTGKVYVNDDLGVGTSAPSEKLEVKGNIYINADTQQSGQAETPTIIFKSKNTGTLTAQAKIFSNNGLEHEGNLNFQVETSSGSFDTGLRLSTASGKVSAIIPTDLQIAEFISLTGGNRTYSDLPSTPTQGMISYITDASSVSYRGTAAGGGTDAALVFYDGSNWIYH